MAIRTLTLEKWSDIHDLGRRNWLFRGQRSAAWELETSLERCFAREQVRGDARIELEKELLREFRRAFQNYSTNIPTAESIVEWLSLMQHHGAPTRLLDVTYSIYVASYFALETAEDDCAVWAINAEWLMNEALKLVRLAEKKGVEKLLGKTSEEHETVSATILFEAPFVSCVLLLSPFRLNDRLRLQKGTFIVPGNGSRSFMDNLRALPGYESADNVLKVVLPVKMRGEALEKLHYMNLSRTSLFPGLDGYARSLGIYHPAFRPIEWKFES